MSATCDCIHVSVSTKLFSVLYEIAFVNKLGAASMIRASINAFIDATDLTNIGPRKSDTPIGAPVAELLLPIPAPFVLISAEADCKREPRPRGILDLIWDLFSPDQRIGTDDILTLLVNYISLTSVAQNCCEKRKDFSRIQRRPS